METEEIRLNEEGLQDEDEDVGDGGRETWGGPCEFLLTLIGYTVGFSNIWRFPYLCYKNGGGAFFIPFLVFLVLCGGPLYYMEVCLGQMSGKSSLYVWSFCPIVKGVGFAMVMISFLLLIDQTIIYAWIQYFFFRSFHPNLGWATCNNDWNTAACVDEQQIETILFNNTRGNSTYVKTTLANGSIMTPAMEFWLHAVLGRSSSIGEFGAIQWHLVIGSIVSTLIVYLSVIKGVKTVGKVVYVTVTSPYLLLTVLLVRGVTLDGAGDGLRMYLYPEFYRLLEGQIWLEAALQVFFSLGPAWGGVITLASFNKLNHNALRDTILTCFFDFFTAFYAGLVVFSVIGFLMKTSSASETHLSGPGLVFIAYPEALSRLPLPQLWSALFFITLIFIGIDSQFGNIEVVINTIIDIDYRRYSRYRVHIASLVALAIFTCSLIFTFQNGVYIFQLVDWYMAVLSLTVTAILECCSVAWIYGADRFCSDIAMMRGTKPSILLRLTWCFIVPIFIVVLFILSLAGYQAPVGQGGYVYPRTAVVCGNILAVLPLVLIVVTGIMQVLRQKGHLAKRLKMSVIPTPDWIVRNRRLPSNYRRNVYQYEEGVFSRICVNVLGIHLKRNGR